jgi:hypothetical protein
VEDASGWKNVRLQYQRGILQCEQIRRPVHFLLYGYRKRQEGRKASLEPSERFVITKPVNVGWAWLASEQSRVTQPRLCSAGGTRGRFSCAPAGRSLGTLGVRRIASNRRAVAGGRVVLGLGAQRRCCVGPARGWVGKSKAGAIVKGFRITTRCSGRTRVSRPVQSTGRATRRAAERERWTDLNRAEQ